MMLESTQTLAWYDRLAALYDVTCDFPYATARRRAIDCLALSPGACVFDLFCGTGVRALRPDLVSVAAPSFLLAA